MPSLLIKIKTKVKFGPTKNAMAKTNKRYLFREAAFIRTVARRSIRKRKTSSEPGQPPTFRTKPIKFFNGNFVTEEQAKIIEARGGVITEKASKGGRIKEGIAFDVILKDSNAIIGPTKQAVGEVAQVFEHGGTLRGVTYAARPFMLPALKKAIQSGRLSRAWKDSLRA